MKSAAIVLALWSSTAALATTESARVATRMRHLVLHLSYGVELQIDDLRGHLESVAQAPPVFDDVNSYSVAVDYASVAMSGASLTNLMNNYVFASKDAPVERIVVTIEGNELVQSGKLKKGIGIPFSMRASVSVAGDGRLRIHPTSLKAAGIIPKRLLDFFGLDLESLISTKNLQGVTVDGDDLLLEPGQTLPPPRVRGKLAKAWIADGRMMLQFGSPKAPAIVPPVKGVTNYMYYRGGVLRFGKLTMNDVDLLLMDEDPSDPFDFSPEKYNDQLIAGYSKSTAQKGLVVHMPDANDAKKAQPATTARRTTS